MKNILRKIKWAYQRAKRGYSDYDSWDIDNWFFTIAPEILNTYLKDLHSWPGEGKYKNINSEEDWIKEITKLRDLFYECNIETCSETNPYDSKIDGLLDRYDKLSVIDNNLSEEDKDLWNNYCKRSLEIDDYIFKNKTKALKLFAKYIHDLWD